VAEYKYKKFKFANEQQFETAQQIAESMPEFKNYEWALSDQPPYQFILEIHEPIAPAFLNALAASGKFKVNPNAVRK
jgi:hypothetical protein